MAQKLRGWTRALFPMVIALASGGCANHPDSPPPTQSATGTGSTTAPTTTISVTIDRTGSAATATPAVAPALPDTSTGGCGFFQNLFDCGPSALTAYILGLGHPDYKSDTGVVSASQSASQQFPYVAVFEPTADTLYPGSIVRGSPDLQNHGQLIAVGLARSGGTIVVTGTQFQDANAKTSSHVNSVSLESVTQALQGLASQPVAGDQAGVVASSYSDVYSSDHASLEASASFSGYGATASAFFSRANDTTENHVLFTYTQTFFSVAFVPDGTGPDLPALFFADSTTVDAAKTYMGPDNPPLYISSIDYGRKLYFMASSRNSTTSMKDAFSAAYSSLTVNGKVTLSQDQTHVLNTTTIDVLAVGGRASASQAVLATFNGSAISTALTAYVNNGLDFSGSPKASQEVGYPIGYSLKFLDLTSAKFDATTHYQPYSVSADMVVGATVTINVTDDDKEHEDGVHITISCRDQGTVVDDQWTPTGSGDEAFYWDDWTSHRKYYTFSTNVPASDTNNCRITINGGGPSSWNAKMRVDGRVRSGVNGSTSDHLLLDTDTLRFNEGNPDQYSNQLAAAGS